MRRSGSILTALVLLAWPAAARAERISGPDRARLRDGFRAYVRESDAKKRDAAWKALAKKAATLEAADLETLVAEAVPGDDWTPGFTASIAYEALGESWTYSALLPKKRPQGLLPLVVDVGHGSFADADAAALEKVMRNWIGASGAEDVVYVRTRVLDRLEKDGRYAAWTQPPWRERGKPTLDTIAEAVLAAIRDAALRWPVDPNRVHVHGLSQSGFWAWWLGTFAPQRFAGVIPVSSVTWHVKPLLGNLRATPVFVLHGTADTVTPLVQAEEAVRILKDLGAPVSFHRIEGGEHVAGTFARLGSVWSEAAPRTRDPFPTHVERKIPSPSSGACFWLEASDVEEGAFNPYQRTARVAGRRDGQRIEIEAQGCRRVTVFLGTRMVDFGESVTILLNGRRAFSGKPKPDPRRALDLARERGDAPGYSAAVDLRVE